MKFKQMIKSYGFWTALAGSIVVLVNAIGRAFGFFVEEEIISNVIMAIAGVLVVFGIVTIPKGEQTTDEEKEEEDN